MSIATNKYNVQMVRQPKRGVYPPNPTFFYECVGAGLNSAATVSELVITDGDIWSKSRQRITQLAPGGSPEIVCQPNGLGAWLYGMLGAVSSTPGTPDLHVFTPTTDLSTVPYWLIWTFFDGEWHLFKDCQIVGGQITLGVDSTWALVTPTIIGVAVPEYAEAPTVEATEETEDFNWLDGEGYHFIGGDPAHALHTALPTDATTATAALTAFKTAWNAHCAVATGLHHKAADAVNVLAYDTPTADAAARIAACTEIRTNLLAHFANTTAHYFADVLNVIEHANPTNDATVLTFLQELIGAPNTPGCYDRHVGARAGARNFTLTVDRSASPIAGESVVPYAVQYKRGVISVAQDLLLDDWELVNLALFGNPNPPVGTKQTTEIQHLSLYDKFISQAGPEEWSVAFDVKQFDLDPTPLSQITANGEGNEIFQTIGGKASGDDPLISVTLKNSVAEY